MNHVISVLVLFMCYVQTHVFGQAKDNVIVRKFTQKDGLSSYNIRQITEDEWGFMWVATQEGISRFDGRSFINYSKNGLPSKKICGSEVREVIEDSSQNLMWALSSEGGVDAISTVNGKVVRTIGIPATGQEDYNLSMLKYKDELWVGSSTGVQIYNCRKNSFVQNLPLPNNRNKTIDFAARSILQDESQNVWVCYGGYGIVIYHGSTKVILKTIRLAELSKTGQINEMRIPKAIFLKIGEVLLATSRGMRKIYYDINYRRITVNKAPCAALPVLNVENIEWILRESENSLLVSGYNGLFRFDRALTSFQPVNEEQRMYESNWLSSVLCLYRDKTGNIWLGCQEGLGFISNSRSPFMFYSSDLTSSIKLDHVFTVSPITDDVILVGTRNGLVAIHKSEGQYVQYDKGHLYQHIFTDTRGFIHVSRPDGLFFYKSGKISPIQTIYPEFRAYSAYSINSHLFINDTLTILGTENNKGLLLWNPVKKYVRALGVEQAPSLASSIVNNIYRDSHGRIWVLSDNVITILSADLRSKQQIELHENNKGAKYRLFFDMCEAKGSYWIASYGAGILELDERFQVKRVFDKQNGLSNDGVYQIHALPPYELLVTSNNGLSRIDLTTNQINRYYQNDGLHSSAFEEVSGVQQNGKIYAGGVNGFTIIDPSGFTVNMTPPRLYFTDVEMKTANDEATVTNLLMKHLTISNNVIQTTVRFAGLNYNNPERTEYAYRILEESKNWIQNGKQASLPFISHPPGHYNLEVKAVNEGGVWSKPVRLHLYFLPKWYQTFWFKFLTGFLILFIGYQLYRFRIRQLQQEHNVRQRLSRDLHDDLGSTMNSINIYTNLAIMEDGANRYLVNIKQGAQESMASIRDIIWILDDQKDTVGQLARRVYQFANPLCEANGIYFLYSIQPVLSDYVFKKEEKRNLYLIVKEAINNSIKYAQPKKIELSFMLENKKLAISVIDDGVGFDPLQQKRGNGLSNMQKRAHEIKYKYKIETSIQAGTSIHLTKS